MRGEVQLYVRISGSGGYGAPRLDLIAGSGIDKLDHRGFRHLDRRPVSEPVGIYRPLRCFAVMRRPLARKRVTSSRLVTGTAPAATSDS